MNTTFLPGFPRLPLVVGPERAADGRLSALLEWLVEERERFDRLLLTHGAVLLRGFEVHDVEAFEAVTALLAPSLGDYIRGTTPRSRVKGNIWTSTDLPGLFPMPQHCEMAYSDRWPAHLLFHCLIEPQHGGETPIADMRRVYRQIDRAVRDRFEQKGLLIVQNLPRDAGRYAFKGWEAMFQTQDKKDASQRCEEHGLAYSWQPGDVLRLLVPRPGSIRHPVSDEPSWFNVAHHYHDSWASEMWRAGHPLLALAAKVDVWRRRGQPSLERARHCLHGDGTELDLRELEHVRDVIQSEKLAFRWKRGDVLVIDNVSVSHGRNAFRGPRKILAALVPRGPGAAPEKPVVERATTRAPEPAPV